MFVNMSSLVFADHNVQRATEWYIQIVVRSSDWKSQCVIAAWEKKTDKLSLASKPRSHTESPPIWVDQPFAMRRSLEMLLEFQLPQRSTPWWGWSVLQSEECRVSLKEMMMTEFSKEDLETRPERRKTRLIG